MNFRSIDTKVTGRKVLAGLDNPGDPSHKQVFDHIKSHNIADVILSVAIDAAIEDALRLQRLAIAEFLSSKDKVSSAVLAILKDEF